MPAIYPTLIKGLAREDTVSAKDAVMYVLGLIDLQRPTEVLRFLTTRFVPEYSWDEAQGAINNMIWEGNLILTPDLRLTIKRESN